MTVLLEHIGELVCCMMIPGWFFFTFYLLLSNSRHQNRLQSGENNRITYVSLCFTSRWKIVMCFFIPLIYVYQTATTIVWLMFKAILLICFLQYYPNVIKTQKPSSNTNTKTILMMKKMMIVIYNSKHCINAKHNLYMHLQMLSPAMHTYMKQSFPVLFGGSLQAMHFVFTSLISCELLLLHR